MLDVVFVGKFFDDIIFVLYDFVWYVGYGDGLFFVVVEDNGYVYVFVFGGDGLVILVFEIMLGLVGVMVFDYDSVWGMLWVVCDDGCYGCLVEVMLNGIV